MLLSEKTKDLPAAQNLFVVQGDPQDPAKLRANTPRAEAGQRPVQDSFAQLETVNKRLAQEHRNNRLNSSVHKSNSAAQFRQCRNAC
ncbi:hypothetical protein FHY16_000158 [Xanthomonas campestris]|uniref:XVIPCD domain-containing protein n=1 Tax=Xanthomonas euroxanthea TaxID=2259622 RepID=UPI0017B0BA4B|nr:XVIPCD domain-containing protein [Xanthomonas euroxanthea]MBB3777437.1 hypothetical protein [Xanthomonas euroxanthea]